jgi:fumarate reductase subunit D
MLMLAFSGVAGLFLGLLLGVTAFFISLLTQVVLGILMPLGVIPLPEIGDQVFFSIIDWQSGNLVFAILTNTIG